MEQDKTDFNMAFGSEHGKRVLENILAFCHVVEPPTAEDNPHVVMLKAGRRDVAMYILEQMKVRSITEIID